MRGDTLRKKRGAMGCLGLTRGDLFPRALSVPARLPHPIPMTSHRLSHQQLSFCCCLDGPLGLAMEENCPDHCYLLAFELIALRIKDTGLAALFSCWADAYCLVTECQPCPSSETFGRADCIMLRSHRYMVRGQWSAVSQPCPSA